MLLDARVGPAYGCGSSFAPPAVAGIAGLLMSIDPSLSAASIANALRATATPVAGIGGGRINAWAALVALGLDTVPPDTDPGSAAPPQAGGVARVRTVRRGTIVRARRFVIESAAGTVDVRLRLASAARCQMQMRVSGQVLVALPTASTLTLTVGVPSGRYRLDVSCASARPVRFVLTVENPTPG
jgi:hypothetical protein